MTVRRHGCRCCCPRTIVKLSAVNKKHKAVSGFILAKDGNTLVRYGLLNCHPKSTSAPMPAVNAVVPRGTTRLVASNDGSGGRWH